MRLYRVWFRALMTLNRKRTATSQGNANVPPAPYEWLLLQLCRLHLLLHRAGNGVANRTIWQSSISVSIDLRDRNCGSGAKLRNANVKQVVLQRSLRCAVQTLNLKPCNPP